MDWEEIGESDEDLDDPAEPGRKSETKPDIEKKTDPVEKPAEKSSKGQQEEPRPACGEGDEEVIW